MKYLGRFQPALLLMSLSAAFTAQFLFTGEIVTRTHDTNYRLWPASYNVACILLVACSCLAAIVFAGQPRASEAAPQTDVPPRIGLPRLLAIPAILYCVSILLFLTSGEDLVVHALWAAGAIVLPASLWFGKRNSWRRTDPFRRLPLPLAWAEWLGVAAITVGGFGLRYWRVTELPVNFHDDVSLMGWFSLDMLQHGDARWFGMSPSGHMLSIHQILIWSMRLFGQNQYGLVMASVLTGTLTLPFVYLLGRETFGRWTGFIAMTLLATCYTHIHFSRIMFGPAATFTTTVAFYAFFRGWRTQRDLPFAVSGLFLGFALLTYDSSRVAPLIIIALFLTSRFWKSESTTLTVSMRHWVLVAAGALLGFGPMLAFVLRDFSAYVGRGHTVMLWTDVTWAHSLEKYGASTPAAVVLEQMRHTFLCLHLYGDESPHFALARPMVGALTAALFTLGIGFSFWRWRDPRFLALLTWIGVTFVLGGVLTSDPPYLPHLNIALPAIVLVAGMAADRFGRVVFQTATRRAGAIVYGVLLAATLGLSGMHSWDVYRQFAAHTDDPRVQKRALHSRSAARHKRVSGGPGDRLGRVFVQVPGSQSTRHDAASGGCRLAHRLAQGGRPDGVCRLSTTEARAGNLRRVQRRARRAA